MIVANFNHRSCITLVTHHMITIEIDMNYVYYMNSNYFLNTLDVDSK